MKNILIGGAWPYANGSLHIGHIAGLLPGDVLARYYRAKGHPVFYVSGSDCHGTPVTMRAKQEGQSPQDISDHYHNEFVSVFGALGFSYDRYSKTSSEYHKEYVRCFHEKLYESGYVYEKTVKQAFCPSCYKALADRLILGRCPVCGAQTRGDQCDACGEIIEMDTILDPHCADCGSTISLVDSTELFIAITKLKKQLRAFLEAHPKWRKNAIAFTTRYLDEGLRDRAITRSLDWGIDVPKPGYENKKIYIWAENVLGYLSAGKEVCDERGIAFTELFGPNARHYYVHGKDNIPFHTIMLPSLLLGHGEGLRLPDDIISSEYVTLEGRKISTSQNWAVWAKDIVFRFNPDALRYFFIANGPEKRDTDFSWHEFVERNNSELLGTYGNFVNRTLAFIAKYLNNAVPDGILEEDISARITFLYAAVAEKIEDGHLKEALDTLFEFARFGNRYFDMNEPWNARKGDDKGCRQTIFNCVQIVANLSVMLEPFLPFSSTKVADWLLLTRDWRPQWVPSGYTLPHIGILFERIDRQVIEEECNKLPK